MNVPFSYFFSVPSELKTFSFSSYLGRSSPVTKKAASSHGYFWGNGPRL